MGAVKIVTQSSKPFLRTISNKIWNFLQRGKWNWKFFLVHLLMIFVSRNKKNREKAKKENEKNPSIFKMGLYE